MTPREAKQRVKNIFWTVHETSVLGITEWAVRQWVGTGKIESTKLGGQRLIPAHAILRYGRSARQPVDPLRRDPHPERSTPRCSVRIRSISGILNQHNTPFPDDTPEDDDETADLENGD
ncbi:MAG: hypothetical protein R2843_08580 [Thermomicrobiales bacterium]